MVNSRLFLNGSFVLPDGRRAAALGSIGGVIAAVGAERDVRDALPPRPEVVDLGRGTAFPGFTDSHVHFLNFGRSHMGASCWPSEVGSVSEIIAKVRFIDAGLPPERWMRGRGFDPARLEERRAPLAGELDLPSGRPVVLDSFDFHRRAVNHAALRAAGIDRDTPDPTGGRIVRDADGEPTGELFDAARGLVDVAMPPWSDDEDREAFLRASERFVAAGFTHVMNAAPLGMQLLGEEVRAFSRAVRDDVARLRISTMVSVRLQKNVEDLGLILGMDSDGVRLNGFKIFCDGAFGPRTAYMHDPYQGSDDRGDLSLEPEDLRERVGRAAGLGWRVCIHAIGDRAVDTAVDAIGARGRGAMLPHRIEHCCLTRPETIRSMAAADIVPVPQMPFLRERSTDFAEALGEERMARLYPLRSWIDAGLRPLHSSDAPVVEDLRPMASVYSAMTRRDRAGRQWGVKEGIDLHEAIAMLTEWPAAAEGLGGRLGRLAPGYRADITVLGADPWVVGVDELENVEATMTVVGGKVVWSGRKGIG